MTTQREQFDAYETEVANQASAPARVTWCCYSHAAEGGCDCPNPTAPDPDGRDEPIEYRSETLATIARKRGLNASVAS